MYVFTAHLMIPIANYRVKKTTLVWTVAAIAVLTMPMSSSFAVGAKSFSDKVFFHGDPISMIASPIGTPNKGKDPLYVVANGVNGQLPIVTVIPGSEDYHQGHWKVFKVTFNEGVKPYLLSSEGDVKEAKDKGDVTIVRDAAADMNCALEP